MGLLEGTEEFSYCPCVTYGETEKAAGVEHTVSPKLNHVLRRLYGGGRSAVNPCPTVYYRENNLDHSHLGLMMGAKLGEAVVCSRTHRRIKKAYRIHEGAFSSGYDIVVVVRARVTHNRYRELECSLPFLMNKFGPFRREGA